MDNYKIGKLIAELRKRKGLTQQELGEMVGVGDRAVSKWERGLTLPDISIINNLSQILGISSDELLTGEIKQENQIESTKIPPIKKKSKISSKHLKLILVTLLIIILTTIISINLKNKTYVYDMISTDSNYAIDGKVIYQDKKLTIMVNKIIFKEQEFSKTIINNYEYDIITNDTILFRYGYAPKTINIEEKHTIKDFSEQFTINYKTAIEISRKNIEANGMVIELRFLNENNQEITKSIDIILKESKEPKNSINYS